jgi:SAM-dependent methyltransferase
MRGIEHVPWLYDALMSVVERARFRRWRAWLADGAAGRVLEIGCGTGRNLPFYASPPVAIDPDFALVRAARRRAPQARYVVGAAEALPFAPSTIDTVVSSLVLCSVGDPKQSVQEIACVLRKNGSLRAIEHVRATSGVVALLQDAGQPFWTWFTGGCHPNRNTERTIAENGFEIIERRADGVMRRLHARRSAGVSPAAIQRPAPDRLSAE